jgi:signal transduction histidine kinase
LQKIVAASLEKVSVVRNQKHIDVTVDIENVPAPLIDEEYFTEVLDNLFDNALRYTPAGGKISVQAYRRPGNDAGGGAMVVLAITDSGCGISEEEIVSLFDKSRITNSKFRKANMRTGLGLAVCREIMEAHEGSISVESKVGRGSTFTLTFPLRLSSE